jgi:hypothetical protein
MGVVDRGARIATLSDWREKNPRRIEGTAQAISNAWLYPLCWYRRIKFIVGHELKLFMFGLNGMTSPSNHLQSPTSTHHSLTSGKQFQISGIS